MKYYYGIYVSEKDDETERLVWYAYDKKDGRKYFYGGTGIMPCIFMAAQSAHSMIKKMRVDFDDDAQFYVRKISISLLPNYSGF